ENPLHNKISPEKIGVMGHSMGGLGALLAGYEDPRITCIVGLAPAVISSRFHTPKKIHALSTPVQVQIGSNDGLIPPETVKTFLDNLSAEQKNCVEIEGGNHTRFMDKTTVSILGEYLTRLGTLGRRFKDGKATITFEDQHVRSGTRFIEWFKEHLDP
ncbi:MAG TPA: alpha/beta hydrolase, partial [Methanomicrobiales archaeon]|nr:alpha/beta hydrolase [Methanomicrobiales archaeon]